MEDFDFSRIDDRVDKLKPDFECKFRKMSRDVRFNEYGSFLRDSPNPPNPQKRVVSSVMDDMIAAVTYIPQPCRQPPMIAVDSELGTRGVNTPSAGFSKENQTTHHCSRFSLPWSILSPNSYSHITSTAQANKIPEVARDSKETQAKDTQTRHPLKPLSQNVSRTKIGEGNASAHQVSPGIRTWTMAKVAQDSKGTQAKARQSVGLSAENPIARQRSPTMQPQARHPPKPPVSHNVSTSKTGKVRVFQLSVGSGSSKENVTPTSLPKMEGPPLPSSYNRAPQNKLDKVASRGLQANHAPCVVSSKENPSAHNRSATAVRQKRHPSNPPTQSVSGVPVNKMVKIPCKPEGSQAKDTSSMSFSKENPSARLVSSTARVQARHSPEIVPRDTQGIQDKGIPSKGSLKENVSAHQVSPTIRPCTKNSLQPPSFKRDTDNKHEKVPPHQGIETNYIPSAGSSNENGRFRFSTSSKGKEICQTSSDNSKFELKASNPQKKCCVSLGNEISKDARLEKENTKGQHSGVSEAPVPDRVATKNSNDGWVGCDICYKWRLLPYGTNTAELPNKWKCKMQTWLPGLNKCSISEEDSNKAFRDLYPVPDLKNGPNLSGHCKVVASDIGKCQKSDFAAKKQKARSWEKSQDTQHAGKKKLKYIDEVYRSCEISAPDIGRSEKVECGNKKQKVRRWEESQSGQHAGDSKIRFTDESCKSYLRKQKKVASSPPSKILKIEKNAGKRAVDEVDVSQRSSDDRVNCASDLCGIRQEVDHKEPENNQNRRCCGLRHPTPDVGDVQSSIKKCNNCNAIHALKEAVDLRDTAKRLKDEGLGAESTRLFFQSALKLLHAASLSEPLDHHDVKYEEAIESIKLYAEASGICKSCAIAFERCGKMAVAALAYKCLEVANFKMAFIQYPLTRKDQHELRATFQMGNPGDSPSSFDPGADCIKTPVWLDPSSLAKDASSSQVADHLLINSPCLPVYTRWLENTSHTICAFEASVKARNAFGAAINRMGKEAKGLSFVQNVLDINFYSIEELLQHIDLSVESINWKYK